jgi:hypothetical protein
MEPSVEGLAPRWHTAALIVLMLAVALTGTALGRGASTGAAPASGGRTVGVYVPLLLVEWTLAFYVCRIGRPGNALRALLGHGWNSLRRAAIDTTIASAGWLLIEASEAAVGRARPFGNAAVLAMLPHSVAERSLWVLVAASAGFCEEVVYRGYLQTQLTAFTGKASVALALQAILFGVAHGEQGLAIAVRFTLYGAGFGAVALWRRSLIAGILCHVGVDLAGGLLAG